MRASRQLNDIPSIKFSTLTTAELSWICMLLKDLKIFLPARPMLCCDNISAISLAAKLVFHARTKHVEVDYHFIHEKVLQKAMEVRYVNAVDQVELHKERDGDGSVMIIGQ